MRVEILFFEGCPGFAVVLPEARALAAARGAELELRPVESSQAAHRERFLGSPTVRVDGVDVEPGAQARTDFGLKCRLYATPSGTAHAPPGEWLAAALQRREERADTSADDSVANSE